jgi:radical SAM protein with 4Fe4S-binding SPASM domain
MKALDRFIVPLKNLVRYTPVLRSIAMRSMIDMDFPAVIGVDPTNICNLKCRFCGPNLMKGPKGEMDLSLYEKIINECRAQKKLWMLVLHNFGEPLHNKNIVRMVELAKKENISRSVQFSTNGTLLNEEIAAGLIKAGLDGIVFSVDAYTREEYKDLKGRDLLGKVEENAKMIMRIKKNEKSRTPHISAKMVRRRGFEHTFKPFIKKWSGIVDQAALTPYSNWGDMVEYKGTETMARKRFACHFLWYYPVVNWDGRVFFCCAACDDEAVIGDLNDSTMVDIWRGDKLKKVRLAHLERRYNEIRGCSRCTYWAESRLNLDKWLKTRMQGI